MKPREREIDHLVDQYFRYDPETGKIYHKENRKFVKSNSETGTLDTYGYLCMSIKKKQYKAHIIAWRLYYGKWPLQELDHISGIKNDNRIINLREVNKRENALNKKHHRSGRLAGASYKKQIKKYTSAIQVDGKNISLGRFSTEIEAHLIYMKACEAIKIRKFKTAKELRDYLNK